ncbi:MAG TPA: sulfite exporter TauE/SafE family protein [Acidimicrobiales bacterium]|jgi:uncharacterized protein|nr:sulfite exporter TauE/SafE family protein [Acidimicrobiales bacterium]
MMDADALHALLTVLAGVVTGVLSASLGIGGAMVSTPAIRLLGVSAAFAVATTLPAILPSAVSGTLRYTRERLVRWDVVAWTAPPGVVAAVAGSQLSQDVPGEGHVLMLATAGLLGFSAWRMARDDDGPREEGAGEGEAPPLRRRLTAGIGTAAGMMSGLLGVGGGVVMVPAFGELAGLPLKQAVATSLACVGIITVPATAAHSVLGNIDWPTAGWLSLGVVPGARVGAALAVRLSDRHLRTMVAGFLGAVAVVYAAGEVVGLVRG